MGPNPSPCHSSAQSPMRHHCFWRWPTGTMTTPGGTNGGGMGEICSDPLDELQRPHIGTVATSPECQQRKTSPKSMTIKLWFLLAFYTYPTYNSLIWEVHVGTLVNILCWQFGFNTRVVLLCHQHYLHLPSPAHICVLLQGLSPSQWVSDLGMIH